MAFIATALLLWLAASLPTGLLLGAMLRRLH